MSLFQKYPLLKWLSLMLPLILVAIICFTDQISKVPLILEVPKITNISIFETTSLYLYLLVFSLVPILALSFDKRVHYYTSFIKIGLALIPVAIAFTIWDVLFTKWQVWDFNPAYYLGIKILGLPIEEWLFFYIVPFACIFIYECLNHYLKKDLLAPLDRPISLGLGFGFLLIGLLNWNMIYTSTTFLLAGAAVLFHFFNYKNTYRTRLYLAYLVSWIPFIIVDGILTGGFTNEPVVIYHPEEFLNFRVFSVPIEDSIYLLLLLILNITLLEKMRGKKLLKS